MTPRHDRTIDGQPRTSRRSSTYDTEYLERDDHATELIRLLSVGLQVLTRLEFVVRQRLAATRTVVMGLYAGLRKRGTARSTTERLLKRFECLTLMIIQEECHRQSHRPPLSRVHQRILALLLFPLDIYTRLCPDAHTLL